MTIEEELYQLVISDVELVALIGLRLYPLQAPQEAARPYGTFQNISRLRNHLLDGSPDGLVKPRFQFTWSATAHETVIAVAAAARQLMDGYRGGTIETMWLEGERETFGDTADLYIVRQDYMLWHTEN